MVYPCSLRIAAALLARTMLFLGGLVILAILATEIVGVILSLALVMCFISHQLTFTRCWVWLDSLPGLPTEMC